VLPATPLTRLEPDDLELIDRLVRHDRTAVSMALLAITGLNPSEALRRVVLARVAEAACWAESEGAISTGRGTQIARTSDGRLARASPGPPNIGTSQLVETVGFVVPLVIGLGERGVPQR
jgi:hypothetical protein